MSDKQRPTSYNVLCMNNMSFPKIPLRLLRNIFVFIFFASLFFTSGYLFGKQGFETEIQQFPKVSISRELPPANKNLDFNLFWRVWDTVHTKYFDKEKIKDADLVYGAIQGMVAAVGDPYTVFLPPSENKLVQEDLQGSFEGVGIQIGFKGSQLAVIAPLAGSPAERVGVKAGDFIIHIKDEKRNIDMGTIGINLEEAVRAIRGPAGTHVALTLLRKDVEEPIVLEVTREAIDVPSIVVDYVGKDRTIAHIKLLKFSGETLSEWEDKVVELLTNPDLSGIILDLRNNPGGFLQGAVELASDFLNTSDVVVKEEDYTSQTQEYRVEKLGRLRSQKMVVLVNQGSASASEILAGALRDKRGVKLVGEVTFGKGTIQEPQQINDGAGLHITIARWLTPSGFWVNEVGLKPDVEVEDKEETEEDEQLLEALRLLESS